MVRNQTASKSMHYDMTMKFMNIIIVNIISTLAAFVKAPSGKDYGGYVQYRAEQSTVSMYV